MAGSKTGTNKSSCKKNPAKRKMTEKQGRNAREALSEYSLSDFLENEPDLYSVSDLKVQYN
ncbi:MAG: hypothetical protein Q7T80_04585 [Methanoregula sp.]|nr:hypothetical protein [Methanoregula sp.]